MVYPAGTTAAPATVTMSDAARLRSINMGQLATPTDRLLAFGRPHKHEAARGPSSWLLASEPTVVVRPRRARRPLVPVAVLAAMLGIASLIALGVGTTHASTISTVHQP